MKVAWQSVSNLGIAPVLILRTLLCLSVLLSVNTALQAKEYDKLDLDYQLETIGTGLNSPWSMVEISEGEWLVTERDGHIVHISEQGQTRHDIGLKPLYVKSQGGLLDIIKGSDFAENGTLYLSYAKGDEDENRIAVASAQFQDGKFSNVKSIFEINDVKNTAVHYAGRLLLLPDNTLMLTSGDGYDFREEAQKMSSQIGKILRINTDGSIPSDNPFVAEEDANTHAIYSLGHRNPQGLVYDTVEQRIFSHEHGPAGGDELNIIKPKLNYGWPIITYGKDYSGAMITPFTEYEGMQQPIINWTPSLAPSGMAFYYSEQEAAFPQLQQHLLVTTLVDRQLYAVDTRSDAFTQYALFDEVTGRLRDVVMAASGNVAILTDGDGASLLLVSPK